MYYFFLFCYFHVYLSYVNADLYVKARIAVRGFIAEGSAYETEKEIGRGKRKRIRNRLFEDTDSDEETVKRNKKSIPAPPSIPFKCKQVKENMTQEAECELNNNLPTVSFSPSKVSYMFVMNIKLHILGHTSSKIMKFKHFIIFFKFS